MLRSFSSRYINLMVSGVRVKAFTDNILDVELSLLECEENLEAISELVDIRDLIKLHDREVIEEYLRELIEKGELT